MVKYKFFLLRIIFCLWLNEKICVYFGTEVFKIYVANRYILALYFLVSEVIVMNVANVNVCVDSEIKNAAELIFKKLGITMASAINMFLRQTINDNGLPFQPILTEKDLNQETLEAIEEGRRLARDPNVKGYTSIEELRKALEV